MLTSGGIALEGRRRLRAPGVAPGVPGPELERSSESDAAIQHLFIEYESRSCGAAQRAMPHGHASPAEHMGRRIVREEGPLEKGST